MEKRLNTRAQYWAGNRPRATVRGVAACHARLAGPQPARPGFSCGAARVPARFARAPGALVVWSPRATRAQDGAVACSPMAWWWLAGGKVLPVSLWGPAGGHRARRGLAGLTEGGGRLRGGVAAQCGGVWRGPHRREGRRPLRLASGAVGEDERGEGGPK
jgi:hypothetical protein